MRYMHFCPEFMKRRKTKNDLIRKLRLIFKFMTSQTGQKLITMHIFPNMSRSRDSQKMKFGQLIKCNARNIFLQK